MADTVNSPNMSLPVPIVGVDPGPQYATDVNNCLSILDQHSHIPGSGVPITPSAMNINADLNMLNNDLTSARSVRFQQLGSPLAGATPDIGCVYVSGVDLYYNDVNGNQIQITDSGGVAGANGNITNLTPPASAVYLSIDETFRWQSNADIAADMDFRSAVLRNSTSMSFGLTLSAPVLGSDYSIILPQLPGASSFVSIDASGNMGASIPLAQGITASNIANTTITQAKMANNSIGTAQIIDSNVTTVKIASQNITQALLAPRPTNSPAAVGEIGLSGTSGSFSLTVGGEVQITNFTLTITTTGRPVRITMQADGTGGSSYMRVASTGGAVTAANASLRLKRGGSTLAEENLAFTGTTPGFVQVPTSSFDYLDHGVAGAPGTYVYNMTAELSPGASAQFILSLAKLVIYEI